MEYKLIDDDSTKGLEEAVNLAIREGWEPIGGVAVGQLLGDNQSRSIDEPSTLYDAGEIYLQAMVKR